MKQEGHYNNTYISMQAQHRHMQQCRTTYKAHRQQQASNSHSRDTPELSVPGDSQHTPTPAITDVPMATSPTSYHRRAPLPVLTTAKRDIADDIAEGS